MEPTGQVGWVGFPLADLAHQQLEAAFYTLLKAKGKRREHISTRTVRHVAGLLNVALNKAFRLVAPGESHAPRRTPENREDRRAKHGIHQAAFYTLLKAKGKRREHISTRTVRHVEMCSRRF